MLVLIVLLLAPFLLITIAQAPSYLRLTALSAAKRQSTLECWQLTRPFLVSSTAGISGAAVAQLGATESASYGVLPAHFDGGLHRAPVVQYVVILSGVAHITIPNSTQEVWIRPGKTGLLIAADTANVSDTGHYTVYPGNQPTIALQVQTAGGAVPEHVVLHEGACHDEGR
ncbi:MAG: hypothetical protein M1826_000072 [Phylliscum demangeonii]|nr:MAG: hypothetical protein M1826_000072 [Phylliscum demangeonii]